MEKQVIVFDPRKAYQSFCKLFRVFQRTDLKKRVERSVETS